MTELTKLEFSSPILRYECISIHENSRGQRFLIRVSGCDKDELEKSIKNLRVFLEISSIPAEELIGNTNTTDEKNESTQPQKVLELQENVGSQDEAEELGVSVEVALVQDLKRPYNLRFAFANSIPDFEPITDGGTYIVPSTLTGDSPFKAISIDATINVSLGSADFTLREAPSSNGPWKDVKKLTVSADSTPQKLNHRTDKIKYFMLTIKGTPGSDYTINGNYFEVV